MLPNALNLSRATRKRNEAKRGLLIAQTRLENEFYSRDGDICGLEYARKTVLACEANLQYWQKRLDDVRFNVACVAVCLIGLVVVVAAMLLEGL